MGVGTGVAKYEVPPPTGGERKKDMNDQTFYNLSPWNILSDMINYDRPF